MGNVLTTPCSGCLPKHKASLARSSYGCRASRASGASRTSRASLNKRTPSTQGISDDVANGILRLEEVSIPSPFEQLLSSIETKAEHFCDVVSAPVADDPELELVVNKDGCKVFSKTTHDGFVLRSEWPIKFSPKVYLDFLCNMEERKTWDKNIADMYLVEQVNSDISITYQSYKKILTMSPRDLVLACKRFESDKALVDVCSSIDFPACPLKPDHIRANIFLGGYYVLPTAEGGLVISYTEGSFGGVIPRALVKKFSATNIPTFVKTVNQALEAHLAKQSESQAS